MEKIQLRISGTEQEIKEFKKILRKKIKVYDVHELCLGIENESVKILDLIIEHSYETYQVIKFILSELKKFRNIKILNSKKK